MFVHVLEGSLHPAEIFALLRSDADSHPPRDAVGSTSLPSRAPRAEAQGSRQPHGKRRRGGSPAPSLWAGFAALANSAPGFHKHHHPETTAIYTSPAFAHPHHSQLPLSPSRVNPNCLHPPACWVPTLQNLNIWGPKPPVHIVTQF